MTHGAVIKDRAWPDLPHNDGAAPLWRRFDPDWYACAYAALLGDADIATAGDMQRHYRSQGAAAGLSPNRYFDESWYLTRYPDVVTAIRKGVVRSGFDHYCRDGFRDRAAHWLFDAATYLGKGGVSPEEVAAGGYVNIYDHFLSVGATSHRSCHPLFDAVTYRRGLADEPGADEAIAAMGAWHHFIARIWFEGRDARTSVRFDPDWFLATHPDAAARVARRAASCALHAYLTPIPGETLNPVPDFDEAWYLAHHADAAAAVDSERMASGYEHFLRIGVAELRQPTPGLDLRRYVDRNGAVRVALAMGDSPDAFTHMLSAGDLAPSSSPDTPEPKVSVGGHVDSHGQAALAEGWLFVGWLPASWQPFAVPGVAVERPMVARFARGERSGMGVIVGSSRPDVAPVGVGAIMFLPAPPDPAADAALGPLVEVEIGCDAMLWRLPAKVSAAAVAERTIVANVVGPLGPMGATGGPALERLRILLGRKPFAGGNTLGDLRDRIFLEVDEVVLCPPLPGEGRSGLALCGWLLENPGTIARLRLVSGSTAREVPMTRALRLDRHDVLESVGLRNGMPDLRSGYVVFVPEAVGLDETPYLEVTTVRGEVGYRPLPPPKLRGMEAIRFLLDRTELRYGEVAPAFEDVLGPSVMRLNADRLRAVPAPQVIDFGEQPAAPELSVIVTLYGRLDFVEYQLAFLSRHKAARPFELIYVLDDPPRRRQLEHLAASAHARFGIPFRVAVLPRNLGFAPANNEGLALARAEHVCFMNSDVFPGTDDWKELLVERLRATPGLGAVGPMLLFEDGCVQHQGMTFERLPAFADWHFPMHPGKGWLPTHAQGLHRALAITGACVVMRRDLAQEVAGFDPGFPVGDFEDSDLCLKLRARGLDSAVDAGVRMYHLERQSQAGSQHTWRMNLTLYNAWLHEARWGAMLRADDDIPQVEAAELVEQPA